ncbi:MAG: amino acid adenylation domain-containing protein [Coriobacteriia bacterium]|nr:amino acid adenylation domain-containing protein [Coriobacteriia bacterium]
MAQTNVLLDAVRATAEALPGEPAFAAPGAVAVTYGDLWCAACAVARGLDGARGDREPVLVLGPKSALTVECFLACLMSGHAYVPVDVELPPRRVADIAAQLGDATLLVACDVPAGLAEALPTAKVLDARELLAAGAGAEALPPGRWVSGDQTQYIIFTSGSTGRPKGIEVTAANVAGFRRWLATFPVVRDGGRVFLDQAHYSFDLSEYELVGALTTGGCLYAPARAAATDFRSLFAGLSESGVEVWVSTPSFADLCLADPSFDERLLPGLRLFLFCGETLHHTTAAALGKRFPSALVANTYGPTESTVAVTYCEIGEKDLADARPLPVGRPRPGTELRIVDAATGAELPRGEVGEIVIAGDTVARGYFRDPEKTAAAFFASELRDGTPAGAYRTGDLGFIDETGMLHCAGRADSLVKLNGYRIELGEVEGALEEIGCVRHAVVVPATRAGRVASLCAFVVADEAAAEALLAGGDGAGAPAAGPAPAAGFALARALKRELSRTLPAYMVPRQIRVIGRMPLNANGKADRKALAASVSK